MRTISSTTAFKRDFRREKRGVHRATLEDDLDTLSGLLRADVLMPPRYNDHPLRGRWDGYRECRIHGDLLLIYRKIGNDRLQLVRLGSHSQLGLA